MMSNDTIFLVALVVLALFIYCQGSNEKFSPGPACPYRTPYASLDTLDKQPDMKAIADMTMLATPPAASPLPELTTPGRFLGLS